MGLFYHKKSEPFISLKICMNFQRVVRETIKFCASNEVEKLTTQLLRV